MSELDQHTPRTGDVVPLATFGRALRYRWTLVLYVALLGVGLGLFLANERAPSYSAATTVQISRGLVGGDVLEAGSTDGVNAQSEGQFAESTAVAVEARRLLGTPMEADELLEQVEVSASDAASSLTFTFTDDTEAGAVEGANAFADAYLRVRTEGLNQLVQRARTALVEQQERITADLQRPGAPVVALQTQLTDSAQRLGRLASVVVDPGRTVSRASRAEPTGLPAYLLWLAGGLIGLLVGWVLAVLREGRRGVIRTDDDLRHFHAPVLGTWTGAVRDQESVAARLALQLRGRPLAVVVVSEPPSGPVIAPDIARALVTCGVQADAVSQPLSEQEPGNEAPALRGPGDDVRGGGRIRVARTRALLGGPRGDAGKGTVLAQAPTAEAEPATAGRDDVAQVSPSPDRRRTTSAVPPPVDVTLVSVPSLLASSAGLLLAADAGAVVLVCRRGSTRLADLSELLPDLSGADVDVLGVVLL